MNKSGSVSVFLALVFVSVSALILSLAESARTAGARFYVRNMADSAIDSVFSSYNRKLWDVYRLVLLESEDDTDLVRSFEDYLKPYTENCGWYSITAPAAEITEKKCITDDGGVWLEQEIGDYLKYGWLTLSDTPESALSLKKQIEEGSAMDSITKDYGLSSKKAVKMEKAVTRIVKNLKAQETLKNKGHAQLLTGDNTGFQRTASTLIDTANKLPELITAFDREADLFGDYLTSIEEAHREDFDKLEEANREALKEQVRSYREYTEENGARRAELDALDDRLAEETQAIGSVMRDADETEQLIEEAEEEDSDEDGSDGSDLDVAALWGAVADHFNDVPIPSFNGKSGVRDEKTEALLESLTDLVGNGFLSLVLPDGDTVSEGKLDTALFPSKTSLTSRPGEDAELLTRIAVDEYASKFFCNYVDRSEKPVAYEMEYLVAGADTDRENLQGSLLQILAIREGLNFLGLMKDSDRREACLRLASTIAGSTALPALTGLLFCLIMASWALVETLMDLKALLSDKKVALFKESRDWMSDLPTVLEIAVKRKIPTEDLKDSDLGISYEAYLKFLLILKPSAELDFRIMDLIQMNLRREEADFLMNRCIYGLHANITCTSRHLFTLLGITGSETSGLSSSFELGAEAVKAY